MKVVAIVAMDEDRVIGAKNDIPWKLPADMRRFSRLTTGHTVLMGRKTYQSLPDKFRPLPGRRNVVVTRDSKQFAATLSSAEKAAIEIVSDPQEYIQQCRSGEVLLESELLWVIGGEQIYRVTLPVWDELFLTRIHSKYVGEAFFPEFEDAFDLVESEDHGDFSFHRYVRNESVHP